MLSSCLGAAVALISVILPITFAQLNIPDCISQCIDQSTDDSCKLTDIKCICRESNGAFLPNMVLCIHGACDNSIDVNVLLTPLSLACSIAGTPISEYALQNAESQASSIASITTEIVSVTMTDAPSVSVMTTTFTATANGDTQTSADADSTSGENATPSGYIPVVVVTTDSDGSSYTTTTSAPGTLQTVTTTDSDGSSTTGSSASLATTTVAGQETTESSTISQKTSSTKTGQNSAQTNSAPFGDTNGAERERSSSWHLLGVVFAVAVLFI